MKYGDKAIDRWRKRIEAVKFVNDLWNCGIEKIALENPVGFLNTNWQKATQIIHPYYFGDADMKRTCLWLKGLPPLKYNMRDSLFESKTATQKPEPISTDVSGKKRYFTDAINRDSKDRSKTFPSIAKAMALQWSEYLLK